MARGIALLVFFSCLTQIWAADFSGRRTLSDKYKFNGNPKVRVAFFDADSTLRVSPQGGITAKDETDVMLLPFVASAIKRTADAGYLIAIVSNQGGIPEKISLEASQKALLLTVDLIQQKGGIVHYLDFAEGLESEEAIEKNPAGFDRKPGIGMGLRLEKILQEKFQNPQIHIDKSLSFMVGDSAYRKAKLDKPGEAWPTGELATNFSNADRMFAQNLGVAFSYVREFFGYSKAQAQGLPEVDFFDKAKQASDYWTRCQDLKISCD